MTHRAFLAASLLLAAHAQDQRPALEAASVKPTNISAVSASKREGRQMGLAGGPGTNQPGKFTGYPATLRGLIQRAYGIRSYQLNGPVWMLTELYEIAAIVPVGTTKEQFAQMLQRLLEERFHLAIHKERKELATYELTIGKGGPRLPESAESDAGPQTVSPKFDFDQDGYPKPPPGSTRWTAHHGIRTTWQRTQMSMDAFAQELTGQLGRLVMDATGLTRKYDITLRYISDAGRGGAPGEAAPEAGSTLAAAVQSQLGLKLESKKATIDVFVIDHLEKIPPEISPRFGQP